MASVPKKIADRLKNNLKLFQPIITSARDRDVNESDTVVIVTDMLADLFGYDKYSEVTSEHEIRGTYCDLAISVSSDLRFIVEVKAIGHELKEPHVKQAIDYAVNKGVDWVILTNALVWQVFHVTYGKPIDKKLVLEIDMINLSYRSSEDIEKLFLLAREGLNKSVLANYHTQLQATNRFILGAILLNEPILKVIKREIRKLSPDVKIGLEEIKETLMQEVLKRDIVVGEEADEACKKVNKLMKKQIRKKLKKQNEKETKEPEQTPEIKNNGEV